MKVILLVDDKPELRQVFKLIISQHGENNKILQAKNGEEAVALYRKYRPDIVFMDMKMPVMDGHQATMLIKQLDEDANIILVSAYAEKGQVEELLAQGKANKILRKPPDLLDIMIELENIEENSLRDDDTGIFYIEDIDDETKLLYDDMSISDEDIDAYEDENETKYIDPYAES